jgi:hypothetical protein
MPMVTQFTVACSRTINIGNFESVRVEASVTITVPQNGGRALEPLKEMAQAELRSLLEQTYRQQYSDRKKLS